MKSKRPDGELQEEFITVSAHSFKGGVYIGTQNEVDDGYYTGRFCWKHSDGSYTRWYTRSAAPKWLQVLYDEVMSGDE